MTICPWCEQAFELRGDGGSPQRFCSEACRVALHQAARRWALAELDAGRLTVAQLKDAVSATVYARSKGLGASPAIPEPPEPVAALEAPATRDAPPSPAVSPP